MPHARRNSTHGVVSAILAMIRQNGLSHGDRLPPLREIGGQNGVSVFAAKRAMDFLTARGVVEARPGAGCFVDEGSKIKLEQVLQELESAMGAKARRERTSKAGGHGNRVGVVLAELTGGFAGEYLEGISRVLRREGFRCLLSLTHFSGNFEAAEVEALISDPAVSGLIIDPAVKREAPEYLPELRRLHLPAVFLGDIDFGDESRFDHVGCDTGAGFGDLLRRVVALGHRRVVYVEYAASNSPVNSVRYGAYRETLRRRGFEPLPALGLVQPLERERVSAVARLLERSAARPTAFVCFNDVLALWTVRALGQLGLRVPDDVSVCGFDDREGTGATWPGLTTVRYPRDEVGERAAEILVDRMAGRVPYDEAQRILLRPSFVERESLGPARPGRKEAAPASRRRRGSGAGRKSRATRGAKGER